MLSFTQVSMNQILQHIFHIRTHLLPHFVDVRIPHKSNIISQVPQNQARFLSPDVIHQWVKSRQIVSMTFIAKKMRQVCLQNDASHQSSTLHYSMVLP